MQNSFYFENLSLEEHKNKSNEVYFDCVKRQGQNFVVRFEEIKKEKSYDQIKGIHKLCELLAPRFTESYGVKFNLEDAKTHVKWQFDYLRPCTDSEALAVAIEQRELKKSYGEKMTIKEFNILVDSVKQALKKPKSFADATLEEMQELITKIEALADKMGWHEVKLTSKYMMDLVEFYNNKGA